MPSNTKHAFNHIKTQQWAHKHNETQLSLNTWNRCPLMSINTTCSQKQHWGHFVVLLFWGHVTACAVVFDHTVVFGAAVLCCDLKRDWEYMLWLRTLCSVFWCCNHSTNNAPSNSITSEMRHPNKLQIFYIRHRSINNKWSEYNSLPPPVSSVI